MRLLKTFLLSALSVTFANANIIANNAVDNNTMPDYDMSGGGSIFDDSGFGFNKLDLLHHNIVWVSIQFGLTRVDEGTTIGSLVLGLNDLGLKSGKLSMCSFNNIVPISGQPISCTLDTPFSMEVTTSYYVAFDGSGTLHLDPGNLNDPFDVQATLTFSDAVPSVPEPASVASTLLGGMAIFAYLRRRNSRQLPQPSNIC